MKIKKSTLMFVSMALIVAVSVGIYVFAAVNVATTKQIYTADHVIDNTAAVTASGNLFGARGDSGYITQGASGVYVYSTFSSDDVYVYASIKDNVTNVTYYYSDEINPNPNNWINTGTFVYKYPDNSDWGVTEINAHLEATPVVLEPSLSPLNDNLTLTASDFS